MVYSVLMKAKVDEKKIIINFIRIIGN
jgi:hypothetical protein